jgi:DNA-directed RNA polymerase subunit M/transcription elongation factor TFIIS
MNYTSELNYTTVSKLKSDPNIVSIEILGYGRGLALCPQCGSNVGMVYVRYRTTTGEERAGWFLEDHRCGYIPPYYHSSPTKAQKRLLPEDE